MQGKCSLQLKSTVRLMKCNKLCPKNPASLYAGTWKIFVLFFSRSEVLILYLSTAWLSLNGEGLLGLNWECFKILISFGVFSTTPTKKLISPLPNLSMLPSEVISVLGMLHGLRCFITMKYWKCFCSAFFKKSGHTDVLYQLDQREKHWNVRSLRHHFIWLVCSVHFYTLPFWSGTLMLRLDIGVKHL